MIPSETGHAAIARDVLGKAYVLRKGDPVGDKRITSVSADKIILVDAAGKETPITVAYQENKTGWKFTGRGFETADVYAVK